ncbi:MAG: hypothetical protein OXG15_01160 [Gammaproteobacteria bacterium]|nr:hypothetical protein [Gammaproteobacteria bacterium]
MSNHEINQDFWARFGALPASSLCGFVRVPRVREALLKEGDHFSILDAVDSKDTDDRAIKLLSLAKSKYEKESLQAGLGAFILAAIDSQQFGRSSSEKLAWVVSADRLTKHMGLDSRTIQSIEEHELTADLGYEYQKWLPWLSLGMVNLFRRWRRPRISALHRALFKLFENSVDFDYPWETTHLSLKHQLPLQVLYRYEPSKKVYEVLTILSNWGLKSINELRCLHPDAISASKANSQPIVRLYRVLEAEET